MQMDFSSFFFFNDTATTEIYTLSLHDALPISRAGVEHEHAVIGKPQLDARRVPPVARRLRPRRGRSEEHTSELQSLAYLVCRLLLEKKTTLRVRALSGPKPQSDCD